jgi:hypothetical protein
MALIGSDTPCRVTLSTGLFGSDITYESDVLSGIGIAMIGIAQDPPAEYPFIRDSYARPMAPGGGARRGPTPAVPRAARLPAPVAATGQVAARGARASADPHARDRGRAADKRLPLGLPAPRGPPLGPDDRNNKSNRRAANSLQCTAVQCNL